MQIPSVGSDGLLNVSIEILTPSRTSINTEMICSVLIMRSSVLNLLFEGIQQKLELYC